MIKTRTRLIKLFVCGLFVLSMSFNVLAPTIVRALDCPKDMSQLDCNAIYDNWVGWVPEHLSSEQCSTSDTSLTGSDNQQKAFNYFKSKGLSDVQAAAIVGNLMAESGINPKSNQNGGGPGRGIVQWSVDGRWQQLLNYATSQNRSQFSLGLQLDFMWKELTGSYNYALKNLKKQSAVFDATGWFMGTSAARYYDPATTKFMNKYGRVSGYENPGKPALDRRITFANSALQHYGTGDTEASGDTTSTGAGSSYCGEGSPDCTNAQGRTKILCEAKAFEGLYYRWGGGHQGYDAFIKGCPDPTQATNNHPHGSPSDPTNGGLSGNPSACAVDCSGLVSIAVDMAFGVKINESTTTERSSGNWKQIPPGQASAGDIFQPEAGHVEIVDHLVGNTIHAFGAHRTGVKTGPDTKYTVSGSVFYRYVGPGAP